MAGLILFFQGAPLKHAIPTKWKSQIIYCGDVEENRMYQNHRAINPSLEEGGAQKAFLYQFLLVTSTNVSISPQDFDF